MWECVRRGAYVSLVEEWSVDNTVPLFAFATKETTETLVSTVGPGMVPRTSRMQA